MRCVELRADRTQSLPAPDARAVVARLADVGFSPAATPFPRSLVSRLRAAARSGVHRDEPIR